MNKKKMLEQLIEHYENGNKSQFAKRLGITPQGVSTWMARNTFDSELIFSKCECINAEWLLTGEGSMLKDDNLKSVDMPKSNINESIIYKMYKEEKEEKEKIRLEKEALIKENGRLEERVKFLEDRCMTNKIEELKYNGIVIPDAATQYIDIPLVTFPARSSKGVTHAAKIKHEDLIRKIMGRPHSRGYNKGEK